MARVTRREWYRRVNASWPQIVPALTPDEAVRAAKKLYRFGMKRTWRGPVVVTSGNRYTWIRFDQKTNVRTLFVNPEKGWHDLVHMISHYCHDRMSPDTHGHNADHARAEMRMIKAVVRRGWLTGKLRTPEKPAPAPVDAKQLKRERTHAAIVRWEAKLRRAENALRKLQRRARYYERMADAALDSVASA